MSRTCCIRCLSKQCKATTVFIPYRYNRTFPVTTNQLNSIQTVFYSTNRLQHDKTVINIDDVNEIESELTNLLNHTPSAPSHYTQSHTSTGSITDILSDVVYASGLQSAHLGAYVRIHATKNIHTPATQLPTVFNQQLYGDVQYNIPDHNDNHIGGIVIAISDKSVIIATCASNQSKLLKLGSTVSHHGELPAVRIDTSASHGIMNAAGCSSTNKQYNVVQNSVHAQPLSIHARSYRYDHALITGNLQVDFFHPISLGLNIGLFGTHNVGKTSLMLDILAYQAQHNQVHGDKLYVVYCSINNDTNKFERIQHKLQQCGIMEYTTIFRSTGDDSLLMQYLLPFTAVTHAEALRAENKNVLLVYDNLTMHSKIYDALTQRIELPMVSSASVHAKLLERTAQIIDPITGQSGSITSFVLCETNDTDNIDTIQQLAGYVDHRIQFDDKLRKVKLYPAISAHSVLGKPAARFRPAITRSLTTQLSQLISLSETTIASYDWGKQFDLIIDDDDRSMIDYIDKIQLLMHQTTPISLCDQFIILYTASNQSLLSEIELKQVPAFVRALIRYIQSDHQQLYQQLNAACQQPNQQLPEYISTQLMHIVYEFEQMFRKQN